MDNHILISDPDSINRLQAIFQTIQKCENIYKVEIWIDPFDSAFKIKVDNAPWSPPCYGKTRTVKGD